MKNLPNITIGRPVSQLEILLFTRHLATMIKAGIPLAEALDSVAEQTKSAGFAKILNSLHKKVLNGQNLATAMAKHPKVFNNFYINLIKISETSGALDENLEFIATQLEKQYALKRKIKAALLYPTIVVFAAFSVGGAIAFFVLPQLVDFFEALDVALPLSTRILLLIATVSKEYGLFILIGIIAFFVMVKFSVKTKLIKPLWDTFLLKIPFFSRFNQATQLAQGTRNIGILLKSGVPAAEAISISAQTLSNERYKRDILEIAEYLNKGKAIAEALNKEKYFEFPVLVRKMISVGEKTGNLDESFIYLAEFYEEEIDSFSKNFSTVLEPILLLVIGLLVGFVALAIITPIYELSGSIRG